MILLTVRHCDWESRRRSDTRTGSRPMNIREYINCGDLGGPVYDPHEASASQCGEHALRNRGSSRYTSSPSCAVDRSRLIESLDTQVWADVCSMEINSNECISKVRSLLSCRSGMIVARSFNGNEARTFVDFLDRVSKLRYGTRPA